MTILFENKVIEYSIEYSDIKTFHIRFKKNNTIKIHVWKEMLDNLQLIFNTFFKSEENNYISFVIDLQEMGIMFPIKMVYDFFSENKPNLTRILKDTVVLISDPWIYSGVDHFVNIYKPQRPVRFVKTSNNFDELYDGALDEAFNDDFNDTDEQTLQNFKNTAKDEFFQSLEH
tara:strand:- start:1961 stop:2479 length:519 start_codon:yes stop_codon:yes gene_type:complete